jgi:hemerythrin-like domain-containing protein
MYTTADGIDVSSDPVRKGSAMARLQGTITESLSQAHTALLEDVAKLEEAVLTSKADGLERLRTRLGATRAHVRDHFQFEEQNGYMDKVRKREPRFERAIQELAEEHTQLAQSLDAVIEEAKAAGCLNDSLRANIHAWIGHIRQHEARENRLVLDAFNSDVSAED